MARPKTLAQQHAESSQADLAVQNCTSVYNPRARSAYELLRMKLAEDKRALKSVESIQLKIDMKRKILPEYSDYIHAVLQKGTGTADDIVMTVMLWRIDIGDFRGALDIGHYALRHGLSMPDGYQRKLQSVLAEEIADTANDLLNVGEPVDIDLLKETQHLTQAYDMADQVRAKLCKVLGRATEATDPAFARGQYVEAQRLNEKSGLKQTIKRLDKLLNIAEPDPENPNPDDELTDLPVTNAAL